MTDDESSVDRCEIITNKTIDLYEEEDSVAVLASIMALLTYFFSRVCPVCQKNTSRFIKKSLPDLIRDANAVGNDSDGSERLTDGGDSYLRIDCEPTRDVYEVLGLLCMALVAEMLRFLPKDDVAEKLHAMAKYVEVNGEMSFVKTPVCN
jgi:hypothetical protein